MKEEKLIPLPLQHLIKSIYIVLEILVFVLLHHRSQPVAVVVQEDSNDGKSP